MVVVFVILILYGVLTTLAQNEPDMISSTTVDNLDQIYTFEGDCVAFHPDELLFTTTHGLYNLERGEQVIEVSDTSETMRNSPYFSPDGRWIVIEIYIVDLQTGETVDEFEAPSRQFFLFSDDGRSASSNGYAFSLPDWDIIETDTLPDFEIFRSIRSSYDPIALQTVIRLNFKGGSYSNKNYCLP